MALAETIDRNAPFTVEDATAAKQAYGTTGVPEGLSKQATPFAGSSLDPRNKPFTIEALQGLGLYVEDQGPSATDYSTAFFLGTEKGMIQGLAARKAIEVGIEVGNKIAPTLSKIPGSIRGIPLGKAAVGLGYTATIGSSLLGSSFVADQILKYVPEPPPGTEFSEAFAETLTGGISASPFARAIPVVSQEAGWLGRTIGALGQFARTKPDSYMKREAISNLYSATAAGVIVAIDPNATGLRLSAEIIAGTISPGKFVIDAKEAVDTLRNTDFQRLTSNKANRDVANYFAGITENTGLDMAQVIKRLEAPDVLDIRGNPIKVTAAQKIGVAPFTMLDNDLRKNSIRYANISNKQALESLSAFKTLIASLQATGDPAAMTAAAKLRNTHYDDLLSSSIAGSFADATEAVERLGRAGSINRAEVGTILRKAVDTGLSHAREAENSYWTKAVAEGFKKNAAGKIVPVKLAPNNTKEAFLEVAHNLTPEDLKSGFSDVSSALTRFGMNSKALATYRQGMQTQEFLDTGRIPAAVLNRIKIKEVPVYDLIAFRSSLLDAARKAEAQGEAGAAQKYSHLSARVLDDLSTLPGAAYDNARAFSKKLNDIYTRTFAGALATTSKTGADRFQPEVLVSKAFSSSGDVTALKMNQIQDAVKFMGTQYDDAVTKFGVDSPEASALLPYKDLSAQQFSSVVDAQSRVIKLNVAEMADPNTGLVTPAKLDRYIAKNADLINQLGLKNELSNVSRAQHTYFSVNDAESALNKSLKNEKAFASLIRYTDSPTEALTQALKSDNPVTAMRNMAKIANEAPPAIREQAKKGLVSMVLEDAFQKAVDKNGNFDVAVYHDALFKPIKSNQPSVGNILYSNGLVTLTQAKNLKKLLDPMRRIHVAAKEKGQLEDVIPGGRVNAVEGLAVSRLGLEIASYTKPGGPGSLNWASEVTRATRNFFNKTPARQAMRLLEDVALDPVATAAFLRVGKSDAERKMLNMSFLARLYSPGVTSSAAFRELMDKDDRDLASIPKDAPAQVPAEASRNQAQKALRQMPPTVQTRGTIMPQRAAMPAPGGASGPPAPVGQGTSSRKMLQSLFPRDDISAME